MARPFERLTRLKDAIERLLAILEPVKEVERIPIRDSLGRVLAADIIANVDIPPFDRAAMDGYAVHAEDTFGANPENPKIFSVIGVSEIGRPFKEFVPHGRAVYVHTGSKIPEGANAVVPIEYADVHGDVILVRRAFAPGDNISKKGEDVSKGRKVLEKGRVITPPDIALMKAIGLRQVEVFRRPKLAVVACGNELVDDIERLEPGKILEYSREIVIGYAKKLGAEVIDLGIVPDSEADILDVAKLVRGQVDVLVTVGGTSIGEHDLIPRLISRHGELAFHGVAIEPGKPTCAGKIGSLPILGLPGLPVATFIATITILQRALERLSGVSGEYSPRVMKAILNRRIWSKPGIRTFARVKLFRRNNTIFAEPIAITGSGILSSIVLGDGIVIVPEDLEGIEEGTTVDVILLRDFNIFEHPLQAYQYKP
ncbi:MAG: molybdopterin molybdotransferase MoeA [Candidatus Korarchaeota archaeon]|nr:molybdopterin molybdotransferase MoeA [Thermoproteota archaeon]